jgi:hypothetical protein
MDPDACLQRIAEAETQDERKEACNDLYTWISRGGFEPTWSKCPSGYIRYKVFISPLICQTWER